MCSFWPRHHDSSTSHNIPPGAITDLRRNPDLAKIEQLHPEMLSNLPDQLAQMEAVSSSENRVVLASNDAHAVVSRNYEGQEKTWLLTAFEKDRPEAGRTESDLTLRDQTRYSGQQVANNIDVQSRLAKLADETDRAASLAIAARRDAKASGVLKSGDDLALAARQSGGTLPMERRRPDVGVEGGSTAAQSKGTTAVAVVPEGPKDIIALLIAPRRLGRKVPGGFFCQGTAENTPINSMMIKSPTIELSR